MLYTSIITSSRDFLCARDDIYYDVYTCDLNQSLLGARDDPLEGDDGLRHLLDHVHPPALQTHHLPRIPVPEYMIIIDFYMIYQFLQCQSFRDMYCT